MLYLFISVQVFPVHSTGESARWTAEAPVAFCFSSCRSRARSRSVETARELQPGRGKHHVVTHLYDWRHRPHLQATLPSALASPCARAARLPRQPLPCARVRPCLAPSSELWRGCDVSEVGINLLWWRREGGREGGGGVPRVSAEALSSAFRRSLQAHTGRSLVPAWRLVVESQRKKLLRACCPQFFPSVSFIRSSVCGMVYVSSESCLKSERRRFLSL